MKILFIALMLSAGTGIALQVVFNARLRTSVESPIAGSFVSLVVSVLTLAPLLVAGTFGRGHFERLPQVPGWAWLGGVMGAFYLTASLVAFPQLGAALVITCAVTGQLITSLVVDTFGFFDAPKVPLTAGRMLGAIFLLLGVVLMQRR